jgi:hypothetical protein
MTEAEWLIGNDPDEMVRWLCGKVSPRRSRLFCVACARHIYHLLECEESRQAVEVAERFAEGRATVDELGVAYHAGDRFAYSLGHATARRNQAAALAASYTADPAVPPATVSGGSCAWDEEKVRTACAPMTAVLWYAKAGGGDVSTLVAIAQDCFGNAVRGFAAEPGWGTPGVLSLARGIYTDRAFDRLPLLADALRDAGCEYSNILDHCRSRGPHVRGCWVVDLVLGKG